MSDNMSIDDLLNQLMTNQPNQADKNKDKKPAQQQPVQQVPPQQIQQPAMGMNYPQPFYPPQAPYQQIPQYPAQYPPQYYPQAPYSQIPQYPQQYPPYYPQQGPQYPQIPPQYQQMQQPIQQQPQTGTNWFAPAVQQQKQETHGQRKLTPEESDRIDVDKIYIDPEKMWQLHISSLPLEVTKDEIEEAFKCYGEIKDISTFPQKTYAFVNFKTKEAAVRAFQNVDQIFIRGQHIKLQSSHNELQIILRRIPTKIEGREAEFIGCLKTFLEDKEKDLFCHIQVEKAGSLYSAYLHFLTKAESKSAFSYLRTIEFTKYCNEQMHLVNDYENAIYVTNEQVKQREMNGEQVNQDPDRELCQFMCLRFVKEPSQKQKQQNQQQQSSQPTVYATSVYLTGIPVNVTEQQIKKLMEQFGTVKEIKLISKKQSETNCNCAVVKFIQEKEAKKAKDTMTVMTDQGIPIKIQPHVKKN